MEEIAGGWDDIFHNILHLNGDVLGTPDSIDGVRACDIDLTSLLWWGKNVCAPLLIVTVADS